MAGREAVGAPAGLERSSARKGTVPSTVQGHYKKKKKKKKKKV
jgi:hypothetical protein